MQVKGYRVRLPLDVLVVASANPEDYTSRGRIITPLKDRYAAQVRTHYPATRELELAVVQQEAKLPRGRRHHAARAALHGGDRRRAHAAGAQERRREPGLGRLGAHVDRELRDARGQRRCAARCGSARREAVPRISDLDGARCRRPRASSSSSTRARSARRDRGRRASSCSARRGSVFDELRAARGRRSAWSRRSSRAGRWRSSAAMPSGEYLDGLDEIAGPARSRGAARRRRFAARASPRRSSSCSRACTSRTASTRPMRRRSARAMRGAER